MTELSESQKKFNFRAERRESYYEVPEEPQVTRHSSHTSQIIPISPISPTASPAGARRENEESVPSLHTEEDETRLYSEKTLEGRRDLMNHLFGTKKFKSHISRRKMEERSPVVQYLYQADPKKGMDWMSPGHTVGNYLWLILFGWLLWILWATVGVLLVITYFGRRYGFVCFSLANYFLWPFGKYLERLPAKRKMGWSLISPTSEEIKPLRRNASNASNLENSADESSYETPKVVYILWVIFVFPLLGVAHLVVFVVCWMLVIFIPMAKINREMLILLLKDPLTLSVVKNYPHPGAEILLYTNHAVNVYYYKYTLGGMNVVLVNLLPFVLLSITFGYLLENKVPKMVTFVFCLLSTIPLSYYNGMAIASLSAQTSMALGAVLNASFGSIIELILYIVAINKGKEEVVRSALTGSLLGALLLIPGMCMVLGGIKYKEQRFSPAVAGVSSVLLVVSIVGIFSPTFYYSLYGNYQLNCSSCMMSESGQMTCNLCRSIQVDLDEDPIYESNGRLLGYICAGIIPVAYIVGLIFTLKTHAHILYAKDTDHHERIEEGEGEPEEIAEWGKIQCVTVLVLCTLMFALISEKLVDGIDTVVSSVGISENFLGITVLAIVPTAAEYLNAVQFALSNNMPLALEIGASVAVQITLFQMPVLVFVSAIMNHMKNENSFTLIFPLIDFFVVFFSVLILNLIYSNGKTNYFIGSAMMLMYIVVIIVFWFVG